MKVLWAVDVLERHPKAINAMSRFLKALHAKVPIEVDAVSVSPPSSRRSHDPRASLRARPSSG